MNLGFVCIIKFVNFENIVEMKKEYLYMVGICSIIVRELLKVILIFLVLVE